MKTNWHSLLDVLEKLDSEIAPHGLYAAQEHGVREGGRLHKLFEIEMKRALEPTLVSMGFRAYKFAVRSENSATYYFDEGDELESLDVLRTSKIKVRKYGNKYRIDPHFDFPKRWKELRLGSRLKTLIDHGRLCRLLLFIGFAKEQKPFESELEKSNQLKTVENGTCKFIKRIWCDPHGRAFYTVAALWIIGNPVSEHNCNSI